jgi:hypothetical protein
MGHRARGVKSALGQKATWARIQAMSALPPKADIRESRLNVRFGPKGDICAATERALFDHLVGVSKNRTQFAQLAPCRKAS